VKIAIVIPCKNENRYISKCLDSVIAAECPEAEKQIFVCDGGSTDGSLEIIESYCREFPIVHLINNIKQTTPYALNLGIENSNADIIIILGAHSEIKEDYISECIKCLDLDPKIGCAGGIIESIYENEKAQIISIAMSSSFGVGNAYFRTGNKNGFVDTVAFGAYKKVVFEKAGLFDTDLTRNQDDEFNFRVIKSGFKIYLSEKIKSRYYVRSSFKKLFNQYFQYGFWKVYVNKKHKTITTYRQLAPACLIIYFLVGAVFSLIDPELLKLYFSGISVYIVLVLFFSILKSKKIRQILSLSFAFIILHLSYGTGYVRGCLYFLLMNKVPGNRLSKITR
jgi:glycosyltransferase involved in cell wall biosynthesis